MRYRHIDFEECCAIARLRKEGATIREIAATLDRSPPTISREISRDDLLREAVLRRMEWGSSPPQVAGRLALEMGRPVISHESIYRFIAAQARGRRTTTGETFCRRGRRRGRRARKGRSSVAFIKGRRPLSERPAEVADRVEFGHWDVRSPWQKGGVENAIGRLRRELPRRTDLDGGAGRGVGAVRGEVQQHAAFGAGLPDAG